ncbi:MAG: ATP-binding cassette domain-containing protein [SAR324 cluster bacterium]|nr:ATP-binding cassette domain-containing protein [SAR324 cluster bacterium]
MGSHMSVQANKVDKIQGSNEFGLCLMPLLDAIGWRGNHVQVHQAMPHITNEMDQTDILNTMANLRFEGRALKSRLDRIDPLLMPCLFIPAEGSVMVLVKGGRDGILVFDGGENRYCQIPFRPLKGTVIFFKSMKSSASNALKQQDDWFQKVILRFDKIFILGLVISLILSIMALISPLFIMTIYDQVLLSESESTLFYLAAGIVIFILGDTGFRFLRAHLFGFVSVRLGNIVGNEVIRRILYLPASFTETAPLGSQVSRVKDFDTVREFFGGPAAIALFELPFVLLLIGCMFIIGGSVAFVPIAAIVLFVIFGIVIVPINQKVNANSSLASSKRHEFLMEMLTHFRAIKFTGGTGLWQDRYRDLSAEASINACYASRLNALIDSIAKTLVTVAGLATMAVGVMNVLAGSMSTGALMASMLLVWRVLAPLRTGFGVITQVGKIQKSIVQLNRLMNFRLESKFESSFSVSKKISGHVVLSGVSIRYTADSHPALLGVNFEVRQSETLIIVGHGGAGKTTVFKLILGLYHPQAGRVMIDNMNVRQMESVALRQSIGYAPQFNKLFYGTIAQNLRLANPDVTDEELKIAAQKATILDDIKALPRQFETRISSDNIAQFSEHFQNGISLARVFLKECSLLILDEPERGVDPLKESEFVDELKHLKLTSTIVLATHNTNYFEFADKILWLEKGRIRQFGPADQVGPLYLAAAS